MTAPVGYRTVRNITLEAQGRGPKWPCPKCNQHPDGQQGKDRCPRCGLPQTWTEPPPRRGKETR